MESIDWSNLSFGYMPTDYNVRCIYKDGKWGDITVTSSQTFEIHMAATCLHSRTRGIRRNESLSG